MQNFRLSTSQMKFHQLYTLISSFCWKYIKFQWKDMQELFHDTEEWCKIWRKTDFLFQKCQEFDKFALWLVPFVQSTQRKKSTEELCFMTLKSHARSEKKLTCGLENDMKNLENFHKNTWKCQNWYFHGILLFKVENAWAKNLQKSYVILKNDEKSEEELTCQFETDIRILTNFDSRTWKSQKFTLLWVAFDQSI